MDLRELDFLRGWANKVMVKPSGLPLLPGRANLEVPRRPYMPLRPARPEEQDVAWPDGLARRLKLPMRILGVASLRLCVGAQPRPCAFLGISILWYRAERPSGNALSTYSGEEAHSASLMAHHQDGAVGVADHRVGDAAHECSPYSP